MYQALLYVDDNDNDDDDGDDDAGKSGGKRHKRRGEAISGARAEEGWRSNCSGRRGGSDVRPRGRLQDTRQLQVPLRSSAADSRRPDPTHHFHLT